MYLQHSLQQLLLDAQHRTVLYARAELASARSMSPCIYMEGFGNHIEWYTGISGPETSETARNVGECPLFLGDCHIQYQFV